MNPKAMYAISYGLFVVTAAENGKHNGCITNTVMQLTGDPYRISVAVNKNNHTCGMIASSGRFTASVIAENATFDLFRRFGFQSGRDVDKFAGFSGAWAGESGMIVFEGTNAWIAAEVEQAIDLGTHMLFIGRVTDMDVLSDMPSVTYAYYLEHIKPKPEKVGQTADGKTVWRCRICGYEYVGEKLPENFICPICKHPASDFEKV